MGNVKENMNFRIPSHRQVPLLNRRLQTKERSRSYDHLLKCDVKFLISAALALYSVVKG